MSDYTDNYKNLLIKQYWDKPRAVAEVELKAGIHERIFDLLRSFSDEFDIDLADGDRLDKIGKIVGISRAELEQYFELFFGFDDNPFSLPFGTKFDVAYSLDSYLSAQYTLTASQDFMSVEFSDDGLLAAFGGRRNYAVYSATLTTPFDVSTMTYLSPLNGFVIQEGIRFVDSGTKVLAAAFHYSGSYIAMYDVGTPYDISTMNLAATSDRLVGGGSADRATSVQMSEDGTKSMISNAAGQIAVYSNPSPFNVTAATTDAVIVGAQNSFLTRDGLRLYELVGNNITLRTMSVAWDLTTIGSAEPVYTIDAPTFGVYEDICVVEDGDSIYFYIQESWYGAYDVTHQYNIDIGGADASDIGGKFYDKFLTNTIPGELTDDDFRFYIRAKIAVNSTSGYMVSDDLISIQDTIQTLFDGGAIALDNMNMALSLEVDETVNRGRVFLARDLNLLPRPQCVEYNSILLSGVGFFGFADDDNAGGFGTIADSSIGGIFAEIL